MAAALVMRVVYVHPFAQTLSGPDESLLALLGPLSTLGVEAHLVVPSLGPLAERYKQLGVTLHEQPLTLLRRGMTVTDVAMFAPRVVRRAIQLAILLRRLEADIVHTNMEVVLEGALAARLCAVPHVLHYRGNSLDSPRRLFDILALLWTALSDRVFCISNATAEIFRSRRRDAKVQVLYNPISVTAFRNAPRSEAVRASLGAQPCQPLVITVGRIHPRKDVETFVRAAARISAQIPGTRFAVVGAAESPSEIIYQAEILQLARSTGLGRSLLFAGVRTDIPAIMKAADLLVLTSRHEGFGRVVAEAMGAGTTVVGSREGALPELIDEPRYGLCAKPGDDADFAIQILKLLRDDTMRVQMGRAAAARSMDFDADKLAERVFRCYEGLLSGTDTTPGPLTNLTERS